MSNGSARGCFKYGCIGCLTILGILIGLSVLMGVVNMTVDWGDPEPEEAERTHQLPTVPRSPLTDRPAEHGGLTLPGTSQPPDVPQGRIVLDLSMGEFTIVPGPADEPIRLTADYDKNSFELEESLTQNDDQSWTYDVRFAGRGGILGQMLRGGGQAQNRLELTIPRGHPVEIVGSIGIGESEVDLGGLWVETVDLEMGMGDHLLEFREPTPYPMARFALDASMGEVELRNLGNASPAEVVVDHSMGALLVDLEGPWRTDASIDVGFGMGECRLWLPEQVRIDLERAAMTMGEKSIDLPDDDDLPADAPTLTLGLRGSMGNLKVRR